MNISVLDTGDELGCAPISLDPQDYNPSVREIFDVPHDKMSLVFPTR